MARHRDFRSINRHEHEFESDDDIYGQSYDDDQFGVSPSTRAQYMYNRDGKSMISQHFPEQGYEIDEHDFEEQSQPPVVPLDKSSNDNNFIPAGHATNSIPITISASKKPPDPDAPKPQRPPRANRRKQKENCIILANLIQDLRDANRQSEDSVREMSPKTGHPQVRCASPDIGMDRLTLAPTSRVDGANSPAAVASPLNIGRRQSSPVIRTSGFGAGDSMSTSTSKGAKSSRVSQLAAESIPIQPAGAQKTPSRPGSGTSVKTPQNANASPADLDKKMQAMRKKIEAAHKKRQASAKSTINLVVVGHVDAGKSTLMGHVLHLIEPTCETRSARGAVASDSRAAAGAGAADEERAIPFAWNLDETDAERDRGVTIDVAQTCFETEHRCVVLLDAPGHKDFIPNMISGAAQADVALLVVNATRGEFETGFDAGGQTREHAMLVRSLGVQQIVVAVNKMDTVDWSKERYDAVIKKCRPFLKQTIRFTGIQFVPVSGLQGVNLLTNPAPGHPLTAWYTGPSLLESIDQLEVPKRPIDKPFRLCVSDVFRMPNSPGVTVAGIVVAGAVLNGSRVLCQPAGVQATVKSISVATLPGASCEAAFAGDLCTLVVTGVDMAVLSTGDVVCDPSLPILSANKLQARIILLTKEASIARGAAMMFHLQNVSETAIVARLLCLVDRATGTPKQRNPRVLNNMCCADVEIQLEKNICMELYKDFRELGRFTLRLAGKSVASGTVTQLLRGEGCMTFG